jgi:hypothetical protein
MGSCEPSGFIKLQRISRLAESLLASQEGLGTIVHWALVSPVINLQVP